MLRPRFGAWPDYTTIRMHKKTPRLAGLIGSGDRLGVRVPVALNANDHVGNIAHCAPVKV